MIFMNKIGIISAHKKFGAGGDDKLIIYFTWPNVQVLLIRYNDI